MSEIILKCINHVITLVNTPDISSGNVNYDTVLFELCPNWTGFTKTAVFYRSEDEVYYQRLDSNNRCTIPKEVLREKGKIRIGLFGVKDNKTITSDVVIYNVSQGAITTGLKPSDPTPDIYAQLLGQYSNLGAEIDLERKRIDSIVAGSTADANAELKDIRIGADGTVYGSAGDAVRSQFKMIKEVNALAIVNEASGKEIIVTDSSDNDFKNLKVYGETTQRPGKNRIKCDASFMGNVTDGITFKGEYETPIGEGELQYIEVSGKFEPLNMDGGTTASSTSRTIGEATLSAGEYIFSQGYATTSLTPYLVLYLDGVRSSDLSTVGQTEKSIKLTKSTVVRLDIEVRVASGTTITTTKVYPMIRLASITDGTYEPYNGVDPSPESPKTVRGVKGKNELDCSGLTTQTSNGITFTPVFENGLLQYIEVNGTATNLTFFVLSGVNRERFLGKEVILSGCPSGGGASTYNLQCWHYDKNNSIAYDYGSGAKFTFTNDMSDFDVSLIIQSGVTVSNLKFYPMIRDASITDGFYAPYNCVGFSASGAQLLDLEANTATTANGFSISIKDGYIITVSGNPTAVWSNLTNFNTRKLPKGKYTFSTDKTPTELGLNLIGIKFRKSVDDSENVTYLITGSNKRVTFDRLEDFELIQIYVEGCNTSKAYNFTIKVMLNVGETVLQTGPFNGIETANLSGLELHGIGDARDYIDLERGVIVRKVGKVVLDGSQTMILNSGSATGSSGSRRFQITCLSGKESATTSDQVKANALCNQAVISTGSRTYTAQNEDNIFSVETSFVCLRYSGISTLEDMKAWLSENNATVYYELKTPIEEPLSSSDIQALRSLHSYKPTTVLTNDVGADMDIEYVADTKLYIDKRISELATAILNN